MQKTDKNKTKQITFSRLFLVKSLLVFGLSAAGLGLGASARAASLYFSPTSGSFSVGSTFSVGVYVSSAEQAMNAAGGTISFPADKLEVTALSKSGSIFSLWVQEPAFSNGAGTISFEGIVMNPGFTGASGKIITATFKVKAGGDGSLIFASGSILANDGKGTNILEGLGSAQFNLKTSASAPVEPKPASPATEKPALVSESPAPAPAPTTEKPAPKTEEAVTETGRVPAAPRVSSPTHPDPEKWYSNNNPTFEFSLPQGVTGVNVLADKNMDTNPGVRSDGVVSSYTYDDVDDGIWYFHIRLRNGFGWGDTAHFRFQIDTQPPAPFTIEFPEGKETVKPRSTLAFSASDGLSGIDYYKIEYKTSSAPEILDSVVPHNPYILPPLAPGNYQVRITAFDKAGNSAVASGEFIIKPGLAPRITDYPKKLPKSGTLNVVGESAYPEVEIAVYLQSEKEGVEKHNAQSNKEGRFTFSKERMEEGVYQLWAEVIDAQGNRSEPSAKVTITVKQGMFSGLWSWIMSAGALITNLLAVLIPFIALVFLLVFLFWYSWPKFSQLKIKVKIKAAQEMREAKKVLQKEFDKSKKDINNEIKVLEKIRARRRAVEEEEKRVVEQLRKDLDYVEKLTKEGAEDITIKKEAE